MYLASEGCLPLVLWGIHIPCRGLTLPLLLVTPGFSPCLWMSCPWRQPSRLVMPLPLLAPHYPCQFPITFSYAIFPTLPHLSHPASCHSLSGHHGFQVWDILFLEGSSALFRAAIAILKMHQSELLATREFCDIYSYCSEHIRGSTFFGDELINNMFTMVLPSLTLPTLIISTISPSVPSLSSGMRRCTL